MKKVFLCLATALLLVLFCFPALAAPTKSELQTALAAFGTAPQWQHRAELDPVNYPGVQAITYEGPRASGGKTKVFAYLGFPQGAKEGDNLPAIVLVHGGNGHAYPAWVKFWNDQGYVALAMDNTGYFATTSAAGDYGGGEVYGLESTPYAETGYVNAPDNDGFADPTRELSDQWMFHAVGDVLLARSLLASLSMVNPEKIGVTGISWGGIITAISMGYADWAFAIPQYCSGYLIESGTFSGAAAQPGFAELWRAEDNFASVTYPVLWLQWTKDYSATLKSINLCHQATPGSLLTYRLGWVHTHDWTTSTESVRFADMAVKGTPGLAVALEQPTGRDVDIPLSVPSDATKVIARGIYAQEPMNNNIDTQGTMMYRQVMLKVEGSGANARITGTIPPEARGFYIEINTVANGKSYYTSTEYIELAAAPATTAPPTNAPTSTVAQQSAAATTIAPAAGTGSLTWLWIALPAALVAGIAITVLLLAKRKRA